ncbi:hypothetical protein [Leptolyngbya sp. 7M]|uniref:hypothetical protein n=1 Tax=Leptolyngbya sp. 7M TaxID=2812896 RepID=UPI001B8AC829|nr:hypothetical protein [Leptolyngbya sp. 7M]QYO63943.1 hypothetical protein JVX88_29740 [Leptolyngbya sp. 7M]
MKTPDMKTLDMKTAMSNRSNRSSEVNNSVKKPSGVSRSIQLKHFIDLDLDIAGWYAWGHHSAEDFLAAVVEQDSSHPFYLQDAKQGWAKFDDSRFEFVTQPLPGFQAVT